MRWLRRLFGGDGDEPEEEPAKDHAAVALDKYKQQVHKLTPAEERIAAKCDLIQTVGFQEAQRISEYERKKEQRMVIEKDKLAQAIRVDVMRVLERPNLDLFEIRRIAKQMRLFGDLVGSVGHLNEHSAVRSHLQELEDVAPTVYAFLLDRAFDGEQLLKEGYERLIARQHQLQREALALEQAADQQAVQALNLRAKQASLELREEVVERDGLRVKALAAQIGAEVGDDVGLIAGVKKRLLVMGEQLEREEREEQGLEGSGATPAGASLTRNFCSTKGKCPYDGDAPSVCRLSKGHEGDHKCSAECHGRECYWEEQGVS